MKKLLLSVLLTTILAGSASFAGGIHSVRSYTRNDGTYVQSHLSGNPGSGIHCHNDVCY